METIGRLNGEAKEVNKSSFCLSMYVKEGTNSAEVILIEEELTSFEMRKVVWK